MRDFAFGLIGGRFYLGVEAFEDAPQECGFVDVFACERFGVHDVTREVGKNYVKSQQNLPDQIAVP